MKSYCSLIVLLLFGVFLKAGSAKVPCPTTPSPLALRGPLLTPLAKAPDWSLLQRDAGTITASELEQLLNRVYVPDGSWKSWIKITPQEAFITPYLGAPNTRLVRLALATSKANQRPVQAYWKRRREHHPLGGRPLAGLTIALDPGHLGGAWSKMEERWFRIGHTLPVEEGTMTLFVAKLLKIRLEKLGARVVLTRSQLGPTTGLRPASLRQQALALLKQEGKPSTPERLKWTQEMLFYRIAEIHHRADVVNERLHPDLVLCLHFDAEDWGRVDHPSLVSENCFHLLISGDFTARELDHEDVRYTMLSKLLGHTHAEELQLADAIAKKLALATKLPPRIYHNPAVARPASPLNPYVWNRNLLATRLMECPVVFCEVYFMNNKEVFQRIQLGDYSGSRRVLGQLKPSLYREYAEGVAQGVINYFGKDQ